ncbi:hypothetical protein [Dokdonella sp.]|uniref:hypothetical protein n=1 Tax=Dokdonella sp. TaxID=2291710 RepID=UPI0025C525AF|nr:hypothetical protein [Dokdonella sp.]MBX3689360.1 hypothetical protein [Dokdonella sp.]
MGEDFNSGLFPHIRIVMGMVLGLAMSKLLTGIAGLIQHPGRYRLSAIHLLWAGSILVELILFWWWEFELSRVPTWSFGTFVFLIGYTVTLYLMAALLFPDDIDEYGGYEIYLIGRRYWFFGLLAATFLFDIVDTMIKGQQHWNLLSTDYLVQVPLGLVLCLIACLSKTPRVQLVLVLLHIVYQVFWMSRIIAVSVK